jgi:hypothetical protein
MWLVSALAAAGSEDANARFAAQAKVAPRGAYPRYFLGEATYWTVAGADGAPREALLGQDGTVEADRGGFSVEPFLSVEGKLLTWRDATREQTLEADALPVARWRVEGLELSVRPFGADKAGDEPLYVSYRLRNEAGKARKVTLWLAARPFQVLPPWQTLNLTGGFSPIDSARRAASTLRVNDAALRFWPEPARWVMLTGQPGALAGTLRDPQPAGTEAVESASGEASSALAFDFDLSAAEEREVCLTWAASAPALPEAVTSPCAEVRAHVLDGWRERLGRARIHAGQSLPDTLRAASPCNPAVLPDCYAPAAQVWLDTLHASLAHLLIHRDGALLQPGSRTYARTWIRDGALIAEALLKFGHAEAVRDFLRGYAAYQFGHGGIPCCVDARGADPTPEHDSEGEFIYAVAEYLRFTGDTATARDLWPNVARAARRIDVLRRQRLSAEFAQPGKRAFYGLLPESISHEGYAARAVHSYWDDFWAVKGLEDAAWLAGVLGEKAEARDFAAWRNALRANLVASITTVMRQRGLKTLPASADLGDFDPTATAIAFAPTGLAPYLPQKALRRTFDEYHAHLARRRSGALDEEAYTPYEIRNAGAFLRLGQRERALELLETMLEGRRPAGWRQWPEIVWRDAAVGKFLGDLPHGWIGAEFIRAVRDLFAYEDGDSLVLAAGVPAAWLEGEGVTVENLPTHFGLLGYRLRRTGGALRLSVSAGLRVPPGGVRVRPPASGAFAATLANDTVIRTLPVDVLLPVHSAKIHPE